MPHLFMTLFFRPQQTQAPAQRHHDREALPRRNQPGRRCFVCNAAPTPPTAVPVLSSPYTLPVYTSPFFSTELVTGYRLQRQLSWRFSPFCACTEFFHPAVPQGETQAAVQLSGFWWIRKALVLCTPKFCSWDSTYALQPSHNKGQCWRSCLVTTFTQQAFQYQRSSTPF